MTKELHKELAKVREQSNITQEHELILINDDVHTFDYVIDALMDICNHTAEQATQCAMLTHYKGQCEVKKGTFKKLRPLRHALIARELRAKIN